MNFSLSSKKSLLAKKMLAVVLLVLIYFLISYTDKGTNLSDTKNNKPSDLLAISNISIFLDQNDYEFLFSRMPLSLRAFQDCTVIADNKPKQLKGSMRVRGNHAWHWYKEKPSLRLRFEKNSFLYDRKSIDLVNPEDPSAISNVLSSLLARNIGLAHFNISFAKVFINKEYKGLYHIADNVSAKMLQCDELDKGPLIVGNDWNLDIWKNASAWEIESEDLEYSLDALKVNLQKMLNNFSRPISAKISPQIWKLLDFDKTVLWSAFMSIIGSLHTDDFHNNFYVYNYQKKNFYPIITDPTGFGVLTSISGKNSTDSYEIPLYEFLTPMHDLAFRDTSFLFARNKKIYELLNSSMQYEAVEKIVFTLKTIIAPLFDDESCAGAVITVPNLYFPIRLPVSYQTKLNDIERLLTYYKERASFLKKELNKCEVIVNPVSSKSEITSLFSIRVKGNAPAIWSFKDSNLELYLDENLDRNLLSTEIKKLDELLLYPALKRVMTPRTDINWLMINKRLANYQLEPDYQHYLVGVNKSDETAFLELLKKQGKNAITSEAIDYKFDSEEVSIISLYTNSESLHPWERSKSDDKI